MVTGEDWSTAYTAGELDVTLRDILSLTSAAKCAMIVVNANPSGYSPRGREVTISFLNSLYDEGIKAITNKDGSALIKGDGN